MAASNLPASKSPRNVIASLTVTFIIVLMVSHHPSVKEKVYGVLHTSQKDTQFGNSPLDTALDQLTSLQNTTERLQRYIINLKADLSVTDTRHNQSHAQLSHLIDQQQRKLKELDTRDNTQADDLEDLLNLHVTELQQQERQQRIRNVCRSKVKPEEFNPHYFMGDPGVRLMQCLTAKVGTTFWETIFRFLHLQSQGTLGDYRKPLDIPRSAIHFADAYPEYITDWMDRLSGDKMAPRPITFLFTRNPFCRLWSVYVDKIIAPAMCADPIDFSAFLEKEALRTHRERHTDPITQICNPCKFRPDFIGFMETFASDSLAVLRRAGMEWTFPRLSHTAYQEHEIASIIEYWITAPEFTNVQCEGKGERAARNLWRVFQINGHIRSDAAFPDNVTDFSVDGLTSTMLNVVRKNPLSKPEAKQQRRKYFMDAYDQVSAPLIGGILEKYKFDFEMFGYSKRFEDVV